MNNGDPTNFDNALGTVVAFDIENLQVTYDLADGVTNPTNVRMDDDDLDGTGRVRAAALLAESDPQGQHPAGRTLATADARDQPVLPQQAGHAGQPSQPVIRRSLSIRNDLNKDRSCNAHPSSNRLWPAARRASRSS